MKVISIIITYNGSKWVEKCFGSLVKSTHPLKIIAVDNASDDGTPEIIHTKYPEVEVINSEQNLGFGKANNIGLRKALEERADYAFLLNQDAWIEPDTIMKLISVHRNNTNFGILSPLHMSGDQINLDNNFSSYINGYSCPGLISDYIFKREIKKVYDIDFVNAAIWLISRECIEKVGGFDPLFVHYSEDDDYINRVKLHGLKVGICPGAIGYHDRPQNARRTINWTAERIFCSNLAKLKDPNLKPPSKKSLRMNILYLQLRSLIGHKDKKNLILANQLILKSFDQILANRSVCQLSNPSFLQE